MSQLLSYLDRLNICKIKLFNSIAMLLGIGMLSEPLAFAYAGWGCGTLLLIFYGFLTCHTYVFLWSTDL